MPDGAGVDAGEPAEDGEGHAQVPGQLAESRGITGRGSAATADVTGASAVALSACRAVRESFALRLGHVPGTAGEGGELKRIGELVEPFVSCGVCSKDGFVTMLTPSSPPFADSYEQVRCRCWKAHQAKVVDALKAASQRGRSRDQG
jgi:hypothetical protein